MDEDLIRVVVVGIGFLIDLLLGLGIAIEFLVRRRIAQVGVRHDLVAIDLAVGVHLDGQVVNPVVEEGAIRRRTRSRRGTRS